jgi:hypothetical protein
LPQAGIQRIAQRFGKENRAARQILIERPGPPSGR